MTGFLFKAGYDLQPDEVNDRLKKVNGFSNNLIIWSKIPKAFPKVKFVYRYYAYNNDLVKSYVDRNIPVLVENTTKYGTHWTLYLGDMSMTDPLVGKVVSTSKYTPTGFALLDITK